MIKEFELGYCPKNNNMLHEKVKGKFPAAVLEKTRLFNYNGKEYVDFFGGRLVGTESGLKIQNFNLKNMINSFKVIYSEIKTINSINKNLQSIQENLSTLRESKARNEATIEGIEQRKKDLNYSIKSELDLNNENNLLSISDLNTIEKSGKSEN